MTDSKRLVVDTNVISYIFKRHSLSHVYEQRLAGCQTFISFQTLAELNFWMLRDTWGEQSRAAFASYLESFVVVPSDERLSGLWADSRFSARQAGRPIDIADAWIAATALALRCPLVTHNVADYAGLAHLNVLTANTQEQR